MTDTTAPKSQLRGSQARTGYVFIFPTMVLYLAFVLLPVIIAAAFVAIVWSYFFKDNGIFNYYLAHLGLPTVRWLTSAPTAMPSIVFMDVWKNTGFFMVIFIAALQGVPKTITEAAIMD